MDSKTLEPVLTKKFGADVTHRIVAFVPAPAHSFEVRSEGRYLNL